MYLKMDILVIRSVKALAMCTKGPILPTLRPAIRGKREEMEIGVIFEVISEWRTLASGVGVVPVPADAATASVLVMRVRTER